MAFSCKCSSWRISARLQQHVTIFLTLALFSGFHASLSVAVVLMTAEDVSDLSETPVDYKDPDAMLSAFFWAYFIPLITGPKLSQLWSPKWLSLFAMLIMSVFSLAVPTMFSKFSSSGVVACRVIQGICQGYLFAAVDTIIRIWSSSSERASVKHFIYCGHIVGIAVSMSFSEFVAGPDNDWPSIFYVYGLLGMLWSIAFAIFIRSSLPIEENAQEAPKKPPTPWTSIVKSAPVWAVLAAGCAHCWGTFTLLTQMPSYLYNMMDYDMDEDRYFSALPYAFQLIVVLITVPVVEKLLSWQVNTTKVRKASTSLGLFLPAIFLIVLAFLDRTQKNAAIACLTVAIGTSVVAQSGYFANMADLSEKFSTPLYLLLNLNASVFSCLSPLVVGFLGDDKRDPLLWRKVFLLAAGIYIVCGVFYDFFASGEVQPWNFEESTRSVWGKFLRRLRKLRFCKKCGECSFGKTLWNLLTMKSCRDKGSSFC